uniref:Uncharacterized protein n=1 Tax=Pipistrellus kuhlii TaxID=59472 RepID=A0A7J7R487_PIPKU|nr:hypothetical protein mPipKuh1_007985 [Pipistrellus kuhlii]
MSMWMWVLSLNGANAWHPEGTSWKAMERFPDNSVGGYHPVLTCSSQVPTACPLPCLSRPAEGSSNRPALLGKGVDGEGLGCFIRQDEPGWARLHCGEGGRGSTETHFWHQLLLSLCPRPTQGNAPHSSLVPVTTALGQLK